MKVRADYNLPYQAIGLFFRNQEGLDCELVPLEPQPGYSMQPPACHLEDIDAQVLMDDLWRAGIRPTEGKGTAGALKAVEYHLEDMRRLVFEKVT